LSPIRSHIDGEFTGTDDAVVYKLVNGQVWQQIGYSYSYSYSYRPAVEITRQGSRHIMKVSGFSKDIPVRRII